MGGPKGLARLPSGETFLRAIIRACAGAGLAAPWVVVGARADEVMAAHRGLGVRWRVNPSWETDDMFGSLRWGLAALSPEDDALVWPVDCPRVPAEVVCALVAARARSGEAHRAWMPSVEGRGGHPVLLAAALWRGCLTPRGEGGQEAQHLRALLDQAGSQVARVAVTAAEVLENWNSPLPQLP
jgi:CTP:molybdopterin cytidylyltransferase MocA